jgi:hypothetical protein
MAHSLERISEQKGRKMTIQAQIRFLVAMRAKVQITKKRRCQRGFIVEHPRDHRGAVQTAVRTRREALAVLLAKVKTTEPLRFAIREAQ